MVEKTKKLIQDMWCLLEKDNIDFDIKRLFEVDRELEVLCEKSEVGSIVTKAVEDELMSASQLEELLNVYRNNN